MLAAPEDPTGLNPGDPPARQPDPPEYVILRHPAFKDGEARPARQQSGSHPRPGKSGERKARREVVGIPGASWVRSSNDYEDPLGKAYRDERTGAGRRGSHLRRAPAGELHVRPYRLRGHRSGQGGGHAALRGEAFPATVGVGRTRRHPRRAPHVRRGHLRPHPEKSGCPKRKDRERRPRLPCRERPCRARKRVQFNPTDRRLARTQSHAPRAQSTPPPVQSRCTKGAVSLHPRCRQAHAQGVRWRSATTSASTTSRSKG